jgi:hypothetical protein
MLGFIGGASPSWHRTGKWHGGTAQLRNDFEHFPVAAELDADSDDLLRRQGAAGRRAAGAATIAAAATETAFFQPNLPDSPSGFALLARSGSWMEAIPHPFREGGRR